MISGLECGDLGDTDSFMESGESQCIVLVSSTEERKDELGLN